jgi:DNA-binding MarR family transcriptional regulator
MSRRVSRRAELLAALSDGFREFSTVAILFHTAIAERLGLSVTDHKCAGILGQTGPITAGELAERTGLTTGAITGVIDRLETAGFVRRAKDPHDRRRVIIEPIPEEIERQIAPLFVSIAQASAALCESYSTEELAVIRDFTIRAQQMTREETRKLREGSAKKGTRKTKAPAKDV